MNKSSSICSKIWNSLSYWPFYHQFDRRLFATRRLTLSRLQLASMLRETVSEVWFLKNILDQFFLKFMLQQRILSDHVRSTKEGNVFTCVFHSGKEGSGPWFAGGGYRPEVGGMGRGAMGQELGGGVQVRGGRYGSWELGWRTGRWGYRVVGVMGQELGGGGGATGQSWGNGPEVNRHTLAPRRWNK